MIPINELRVGNKILFDSEIDTVTEIHSKSVNGEFKSWWHFDRLHGIPLTPELLTKCGIFVNLPGTMFWDEDENILLVKDNIGFYAAKWIDNEGETIQISIYIKSLHQLQNLYFSLCGKELEVTLP